MDFHAWVNTILAVIAIVVTITIFIRNNQTSRDREITKMGVKVDTMWASYLTSGVVKGIDKGLLVSNSPVRLTPESLPLMESLREDLMAFHKNDCPDCDEKELALEISERFKEELVAICAMNGIQFEVGLLIATAIAKGHDTLTDVLDKYHPPGGSNSKA